MSESKTYDVVVVGGGAAGVAAAVSAARSGAHVALLENHSFLGGKATTAEVGTICGLYLRNEQGLLHYASNGFAKEFEEKIKFKSRSVPVSGKNGLWFLPYHPFDFKRLCDELTLESKVDLYFHSMVSSVDTGSKKVELLTAVSYDREIVFKPGSVVDCTGEAMIPLMCGIDVVECDEYQSSAQVFTMEGLTAMDENVLSLILIREIMKGVESGRLEHRFSYVSIVPGSCKGTSVSLKIGIPEKVTNEPNKITPIELLAREMVEKVAAFLINAVPPFKNAYVSNVAPEAGVRTGRRPVGVHELQEEDVMQCKKTREGIANGSWPIEIWSLGNRVNMQYFAPDDYYQIPHGCLRSSTIDNLYFAGRHLAASNKAIASARVIGTCLSTGYAAGKMAALSVAAKPWSETIAMIRDEQVIL